MLIPFKEDNMIADFCDLKKSIELGPSENFAGFHLYHGNPV